MSQDYRQPVCWTKRLRVRWGNCDEMVSHLSSNFLLSTMPETGLASPTDADGMEDACINQILKAASKR